MARDPVHQADTANAAKTVFVVHGRDKIARDGMFAFLRSVGLRPLEWSQAIALTGSASPFVGDILRHAFEAAGAVVVLLTPDDVAYLRRDLQTPHEPDFEVRPTGQARPNVLFEAGMAFGRAPDRTILVEIGPLRPFSDVGGRHVVRFDGSIARRQDLAHRLEGAGCTIDLSGTDWHSAGNFASAPLPVLAPVIDLRHAPTQVLDRLAVWSRHSGADRLIISVQNNGESTASQVTVGIPESAPAIVLDETPRELAPGRTAQFTIALLTRDGSATDAWIEAQYADGESVRVPVTDVR